MILSEKTLKYHEKVLIFAGMVAKELVWCSFHVVKDYPRILCSSCTVLVQYLCSL